MACKIRLARGGRKKKPFYSIIVADTRSPRDGKFLEKLGTYNPMLASDAEDRVVISDQTRVDYWFSVGAQVSDTVHRLLSKKGVQFPQYIEKKHSILKASRVPKKPKKDSAEK